MIKKYRFFSLLFQVETTYTTVGGFKEKAAMILKRLSPTIFDMFIKNQKVT